jgi:hypothetical protein
MGPFDPNQAPAQTVPQVPTVPGTLPSMVPPEMQLSGAQLPTADYQPLGPAQTLQPDQPLLAGKYRTPQELERAYLENQQFQGRQAQEIGLLRDQFFQMQQWMIGQSQQQATAQPAQQQAPAQQQQNDAQRTYEMLKPLVSATMKANEGMDEDTAWDLVYGQYATNQALVQQAVEAQMQPVMQQVRAAQQATIGQALTGQVQQVLATGQYQTVQPHQLLQMAQQLPVEQLASMDMQQLQQYVQTMADIAEAQNRRMGAQQPGFQPMPPANMGNPTLQPQPYGQPGAPPFNPMVPQQPPMGINPGYGQPYPQPGYPPQPRFQQQQQPYQPIPQGQVPGTLAPQGQYAPGMDPNMAGLVQYYQQNLLLPPDRAMRAAQAAMQQQQPTGRQGGW